MASRLGTYRTIAKILSWDTPNSELQQLLEQPDFDWDALVIEGSKHLVLPTIYCRLKQKALLHMLPEELNNYLEELTAINRNRNESIKTQILKLTTVLDRNAIDYVLLKGAALLMANIYKDPGERMIGDIDVLIAVDQLDLAFDMLKKEGYYPIETTFGDDFFEHKHLPRLRTDTHLAAVELHRKLFTNYTINSLVNANVLMQKQMIKNSCLPSSNHLLLHNILNFQVSDYGHTLKAIGFRTAYDHILVSKCLGASFSKTQLKNKNIRSFLSYHNELFGHDIVGHENYSSLVKIFLTLRLKYPKYDGFRRRILYTAIYFKELLARIGMFIRNKDYRNALWADRKRIIYTLKRQVIHNKPPH
jgi:hypothetical protein